MTEDPHEITEWILLGSAIMNARASGLDIQDVETCWRNSANIKEFDAAIAAEGKMRMMGIGKKIR